MTTLPIVATILPPREKFAPDSAGAIGLLVHRLAGVRTSFDMRVIGASQPETFPGIPFRAAPMPLLRLHPLRRYEAGVARLLRAAPPALIEVHNRPDMALYLADRFPEIPVCLFLHNDPRGMRHARTPAERATLLSRLAQVVTVSDFLRGLLLEGVTTEVPPPAVLPNNLDLRAIPPAPEPRDRTILFAGRVVADKGADLFVGACARALPALPGWRAEMIGADRFGPDTPETPFLRTIRPRAAAAGVAMAGYRPHDAVLAAMARAAIVAVPSRWPEPFGLTALEAMATGAALITAPNGALPEVVGEAALVTDPADIPAFAAAIRALADNPARRRALGEAGRARARQFDLPQAAAALDTLRRDVLRAWSRKPDRPI
jgi:UDP-glucose:(glucosyl)LPS alpha-1,2-glucosyltransferase